MGHPPDEAAKKGGVNLSGLSRFLAKPNVRAILLLDLVEFDVDERKREWFDGCKFQHTSLFPIARYELFRTFLLAAAGYFFLPYEAVIALIVGGIGLAGVHTLFEERAKRTEKPNSLRLKQLKALIIGKAIYWAAAFAACLYFAPEPLRIPIGMMTTLALVSQGIKLIAIPKTGMLVAAIQAVAISGTFFWLGGVANTIAGIFTILSLNAVHWGLYNLHYLFATRRLRTRELREKNETVQLLLNQYDEEGSDWLFETDHEGRLLNPSERFAKAAGISREELKGLRFSSLMEHSHERDEYRGRVMAGQSVRDLVVQVNVKGQRRYWSLSVRPFEDHETGAKIWRGFVADVTKAREAEEKVAFLAHNDPLTGLPNRNLFGATLGLALSRREPDRNVAIIQVDLSQFREVNDMHGHEIGDHVLIDSALAIKAAAPQDATIARLGGDEFAVIIEDLGDPEAAQRTAKAIAAALRQPVTIDGHQFKMGSRIGLAMAPQDGETSEDILRAANLALQDAKTKGRNAITVFDAEMQQLMRDRRKLEQDLRKALVNGELEVQYQPLVDSGSGNPVGYEALLRWHHPQRGSISPALFIPIAEESGQIIPIGGWVLREALNEAATWPEDIFISINLSPIQMKDPKLVSNIFMALSASGVAPSRVELEITESVLLTDNEENLAILHKIRDLGVKIVMDDFGTGYSSLSYLRSFPFDKIKIDRCFVTDLAEKSDSQAIVNAVIKLAEELGMCTLAEGVENIEQLERLRETGCEQVQGFLFSRAQPSSELAHKQAGAQPASPPKPTVTPFVKGKPDDTVKPGRAKVQNSRQQRAAG